LSLLLSSSSWQLCLDASQCHHFLQLCMVHLAMVTGLPCTLHCCLPVSRFTQKWCQLASHIYMSCSIS
jgi:hypothetical protein